jgi:hypothetical protein
MVEPARLLGGPFDGDRGPVIAPLPDPLYVWGEGIAGGPLPAPAPTDAAEYRLGWQDGHGTWVYFWALCDEPMRLLGGRAIAGGARA